MLNEMDAHRHAGICSVRLTQRKLKKSRKDGNTKEEGEERAGERKKGG